VGKLQQECRRCPYSILGACNPPFAYQALQTEDKIGTILPCGEIIIVTNLNIYVIIILDKLMGSHF
jgi:uncharacterized protein (DUF302 family)